MWFAIVGKRTAPRHDRAHAHPRREPLAFEGQHLVVAGEPGHRDQLGPRAGLLVLDEAGVGDLAAALRVEGRLLELGLEAPVVELLVGDDRSQHSVFS